MSSIPQALQSLGVDIRNIFGGGNQGYTPFGSLDQTQQMGINAALTAPGSSLAGLQGQVASAGPTQAQGPVTSTGGTQTGATPNTQSPVNASALGKLYLDYLMQKRLQGPRFTGGFSAPSSAQPPFSPFAQTPAAIMPPQVQL